jgi:hypothetical protein
VDLLIGVNMLLAQAGSIFTFVIFLQDKTPFRWVGVIGAIALAYIAAFYAHGLLLGAVPPLAYFRPGLTVLLACILAESIYDKISQ